MSAINVHFHTDTTNEPDVVAELLTEEKVREIVQEITAAAITEISPENPPSATGEKFYIEIIPEGRETDDRRYFEYGSLEVRDLPVPLMMQLQTGEGGRVISNVWRKGGFVVGTGNLFEGDENADEAAKQIAQGYNRVSADVVKTEYFIEWGVGEDGFEEIERIVFTEGKVAGATIVGISAFDEARIYLGDEPTVEESMVASGAFPDGLEAAFEMPEHDEPMPITMRELPNGLLQIYGYVALWDTCHIGKTSCVTAPHSRTNYANFMTGLHKENPVGVLTMDTGHARVKLSLDNTVRHYEDTGTVAAYIQTRETEFGIAFCGYVEPSLSEPDIRRLSACGVSGDWRYDKNVSNLELCAVLAVPTPGFTTPRAFEASPGKQLSLVAAGTYCRPCQEQESVDDILNTYFSNKDDLDELLDKVV